MEFKALVKKEQKEWKQRMIDETGGAYILLYLALIFCVFGSMQYGFHYDKDDYFVLVSLAVGNVMVYSALTGYITGVKENGKRVNIFRKYKYIPIDFKLLRRAKIYVVCKILALPIIISQGVSLMIRIVDPDKDGGSILEVNVWLPVIMGVLFILFEKMKMYV